jgi:hypothetical protein
MNINTFLKDTYREYKRWRVRKKIEIDARRDIKRMARTIKKADKATLKSNKRLWVVKLDLGTYVIYTKEQMRKIFFGLGINYSQKNEFIVHITKKPQ